MQVDRGDYSTGKNSLELKAGSKRHQHIVGFESPEGRPDTLCYGGPRSAWQASDKRRWKERLKCGLWVCESIFEKNAGVTF